MVRIPLVHRIRFSLRTFFVTLFVLSLFGSNAYVSWKWHEAQNEIERLRDELGYLKIDDPARFYVRQVRTFDPLSWQWRIYVPPGEREFHFGSGRIEETGTKAGSGGGHYSRRTKKGSSVPVDPMQGEYTLCARVEQNQRGQWQLVVSYPDGRITHSITKSDAGWLAEGDGYGEIKSRRKTIAQVAGSGQKTESFAADDTIVLLRLRAPTDEQAAKHEPCDGVLIWFEKLRRPITTTSASRTDARRPARAPPQPAD